MSSICHPPLGGASSHIVVCGLHWAPSVTKLWEFILMEADKYLEMNFHSLCTMPLPKPSLFSQNALPIIMVSYKALLHIISGSKNHGNGLTPEELSGHTVHPINQMFPDYENDWLVYWSYSFFVPYIHNIWFSSQGAELIFNLCLRDAGHHILSLVHYKQSLYHWLVYPALFSLLYLINHRETAALKG